jgi:hypothetical protein
MAGHLGSWTLFDYIGEPNSRNRAAATPAWPQVSCNFGSFDLCGFSKPAAYHYKSWWLGNVSADDKSRPPVGDGDVVKLVHDWKEPAPPIVAVYSNLPLVELFLNGRSLGRQRMAWANWTQWAPPFVPGNLTAVGYSADGVQVASDTSLTPGTPCKLLLTIDAPSKLTGTGEALLLDGQDAAMLRASVVDTDGVLVATEGAFNVSFTVASGPGRVVGVGNGNPVSHERNRASWRSTHYGLARAVVQTTLNAATGDRARQIEIDLEGGRVTQVAAPAALQSGAESESVALPTSIVVEAHADGLGSASVTIPVSQDAAVHSVIAVAARSVGVSLSIS